MVENSKTYNNLFLPKESHDKAVSKYLKLHDYTWGKEGKNVVFE